MRKTIPSPRRPQVVITPAMQDRFEQQAARFRQAMDQLDFAQARLCCEQVLKVIPQQMQVLSDYALVLMRLGEHQKAWKIYQRIYQSPHRHRASDTWLDGLAELSGLMNKPLEVKRYGHESLSKADAIYKQNVRYPFPARGPEPLDLDNPQKNIIAFSLYGHHPRYCETLIKNVEVARELYPAWTCRIYLDDSVPQHVWHRLQQPNVQLVDMSHEKTIMPTLWRFLVMDDSSVERFIVRDADSLLSEREVVAVEAWVASPFWFHHMRDYCSHTELLLAGMWGGCHGVFHNIEQQIRDFMTQYSGSARFTDQVFLKTALWATVRESLLSHDDIFDFHDAHVFPPHPPVRWQGAEFHVGSNAGYTRVGGPASVTDNQPQWVKLCSDAGEFAYPAPVKNGEWSLAVPFFLVTDYQNGKLRFVLTDA